MTRLEPPERWIYGILAAAFIVSNIGILVLGWTEYWQYMGVTIGITAVGLALFFMRYRGSN